MDETELEMLNELKKIPDLSEVYHKTTFKCYRNAKKGGMQEVLVEVLDGGPENQTTRYSVIATTPDGKRASGNSSSSIAAAIAMVHWWNLDK
jgi:hypothetical protein